MNIADSIITIKGIGEKNAALFQKLKIETVADLLYHFPRDYEQMPPATSLREAEKAGGGKCAIKAGILTAPTLRRFGGKTLVSFEAGDEFGDRFKVSYFNMPFLAKTLKKGKRCVFYGSVLKKNNANVMTQPKMIAGEEYAKICGAFYPIYAKTKGLTDAMIQKCVRLALTELKKNVETTDFNEYLPEEIVAKRKLIPVLPSLETIHFPSGKESLLKARERFSYEELFLFLLSVKSRVGTKSPNLLPMKEAKEAKGLIKGLPYELTGSQKQAYQAILSDLASPYCMNRLLQGDVGCGKTIVAFLALLTAASNGYQSVMMAPTEVLAGQHYEQLVSLTERFNLPIQPALLTGSVKASEKKRIYADAKEGSINVLIGTHALLQESVAYKNLGLVITDEQHRFGVKQREVLREKGEGVHTIVMSATPIPRSLAIVLYGQLDVTQMPDMPAKRLPIKNCVVDQNYRPAAYKFMAKQIAEGRQVYVICPMALSGVMDGLENVIDYAKELKEQLPEGIRIDYLHGKMRPKEKNRIMEEFAGHKTDILVSTTVIEVGINVPNATVMLVENAERFGLATLHQIRGRVGRGEHQSYCIFMQTGESGKKNERLEILNHSTDGFEIARKDLELRGPGDMMGIEQSGGFSFRFADIYRDQQILLDASSDADAVLKEDPLLKKESSHNLAKRLKQYNESGYLDIL